MNKHQKTVVVGMSGGVDSSLAAALLKEQGYAVIGVYMKNWSEPIAGVEHCPWVQDQLDARRVAQQLEIPFYTVNFEQEYKRHVIDAFFADYAAGRTPNPDVLCNRFIKFDAFYRYARSLGADYIATGHYVRVIDGMLYKGKDTKKDQSYFLWAVQSEVLKYVLFPLGQLTKTEVREMARTRGLITAKKRDSQGICFIGQADVRAFLAQHLTPKVGAVLDTTGHVIGHHQGSWFYTIGQRAGISDLRWLRSPDRPTLYVLETNVQDNTITVGEEHELYASSLMATQPKWFGPAPSIGRRLHAKIRYGQQDTPCAIVEMQGDVLTITFEKPQRAITAGQSVVLYDKDRVIGGGIIETAHQSQDQVNQKTTSAQVAN